MDEGLSDNQVVLLRKPTAIMLGVEIVLSTKDTDRKVLSLQRQDILASMKKAYPIIWENRGLGEVSQWWHPMKKLGKHPNIQVTTLAGGLKLYEAAKGKEKEGARELTMILERYPDELVVYPRLATFYLHSGRPREAVETMKKAREQAPKNASVRLDLAKAHAAARELPLAIAEYREAQRLAEPGSELAAEAARLEQVLILELMKEADPTRLTPGPEIPVPPGPELPGPSGPPVPGVP